MAEQATYFGSRVRYRAFTAVKYLVYALLSFNVYLFLQEELLALEHTFVGGISPGQLVQVFSATIDTAAWVVLLLLFELETSVLDDRKIRGPVKWTMHGIRGICTIAIVWAFTGYYAELVTLYDVTSLNGVDVCSLLDRGSSLLVNLDEYVPLDAANCAALSGEVYRLNGFEIVADGEVLQSARMLAWTDVINAAAWILVVIVLEIEVRLQLRGDLSGQFMHIARFFKLAIYAVLFGAAAYWGYAGDFLDFWDAALWLFAFIFIELNVFEWQYESTHPVAVAA